MYDGHPSPLYTGVPLGGRGKRGWAVFFTGALPARFFFKKYIIYSREVEEVFFEYLASNDS